jgi:hypothetical protein
VVLPYGESVDYIDYSTEEEGHGFDHLCRSFDNGSTPRAAWEECFHFYHLSRIRFPSKSIRSRSGVCTEPHPVSEAMKECENQVLCFHIHPFSFVMPVVSLAPFFTGSVSALFQRYPCLLILPSFRLYIVTMTQAYTLLNESIHIYPII